MKFILPLIISLFIVGCTLPEGLQPKKQTADLKKPEPIQKELKKPIVTKKTDEIFSTQYDIKEEHVYSNLNNTIVDIANQLFDTKINHKNPTRVILTSFVDLENFDKTSTFGRLLSESMFNELHIRKFLVTDFRGQAAVSVNEDGEFHITRDVEKLKDDIEAIEYILVGTYVKFEDQSLLINARIMDSVSGKLLSTARVVYHPRDCSLFGICKQVKQEYNLYDGTADLTDKNVKQQIMDMNARDKSNFTIISDDCKDGSCDK
ncbi:MAG: FlgO family outer membrane protein [Arcobacteraceae bacterium]